MISTRPSRTLLACLFAAILLPLPVAALNGQDAPVTTRRVLLVTGEDYPGHKWRETAPALLAELSKDPRLTVNVLADLKSLSTTRLSDYSAVVIHFKNYDPDVPGRAGYDNLTRYVEQGGGLMLVHFACGAFEQFKHDFEQLAGRVWFGMQPPEGRHQHDPHGRFTVNIAVPDHPITKGMSDFETVDELYTCLVGDTPITVVATAVSKVDGKTHPMAFVHDCGKGRVFHSVLGHDVEAFRRLGRLNCIAAAAPGPLVWSRRLSHSDYFPRVGNAHQFSLQGSKAHAIVSSGNDRTPDLLRALERRPR